MKTILTTSALASAVVFGGLFFATPSVAQDDEPCVDEYCSGPDMQVRKKQMEEDDEGDQVRPRKKRYQSSQQDTDIDVDVDVRTGSGQRARHGDWRFDPNRHHRRRSRSTTYRFYLDGYWYPQPY